MDNKTMQTKYKKNIAQIVVLVIAITIITLAAGTSYAILNGTVMSDNEQLIRAGNVTLQLTEHFDNLSDGVRVMEDSDGLISGTTYNFTIKNVGTVGAEYTLKLENEVPSSYNGNVLSTNYFKVGVEINGKEYGPMGLQDVNNIIDKNTVAVNEVNSYKLRVWLDKEQEDELENKDDYNAFLKLKVEAKQNTTVKRVITNSVYRCGTDDVYIGSDLEAGEHTGYCLVWDDPESNDSFSSCVDGFDTNAPFGFLTQAACEAEATRLGGQDEGYSCTTGSWTSAGFTSTTDYTTLNKQVFLKHDLDSNNRVEASYVCFILNDEVYCLKGGDGAYDSITDYVSQSYENNKQILNNSFGSSNCDETNDLAYECGNGNLYVSAASGGSITTSFGAFGASSCSVDSDGYSRCSISDNPS